MIFFMRFDSTYESLYHNSNNNKYKINRFSQKTDFAFKLKNAQLVMVVVLMFVQIRWTKVKMSRVPVKGHLLLLIPTEVLLHAVSFHQFHIYQTLNF